MVDRIKLLEAITRELAIYRTASHGGGIPASWLALERAHILSQAILIEHLRVHALMFGLAVKTLDAREMWGQTVRLILAPLGSLTGRIPWGNTGRANVSAFQPMPVPEDLAGPLSD